MTSHPPNTCSTESVMIIDQHTRRRSAASFTDISTMNKIIAIITKLAFPVTWSTRNAIHSLTQPILLPRAQTSVDTLARLTFKDSQDYSVTTCCSTARFMRSMVSATDWSQLWIIKQTATELVDIIDTDIATTTVQTPCTSWTTAATVIAQLSTLRTTARQSEDFITTISATSTTVTTLQLTITVTGINLIPIVTIPATISADILS